MNREEIRKLADDFIAGKVAVGHRLVAENGFRYAIVSSEQGPDPDDPTAIRMKVSVICERPVDFRITATIWPEGQVIQESDIGVVRIQRVNIEPV